MFCFKLKVFFDAIFNISVKEFYQSFKAKFLNILVRLILFNIIDLKKLTQELGGYSIDYLTH